MNTLSTLLSCKNDNELWLAWLKLKLTNTDQSSYLNFVLENNQTFESFIHDLYCGLLKISRDDYRFETFYLERKNLFVNFLTNLDEVQTYCRKAERLSKNCVYYLTDLTDEEKYTFIKIICENNFTDQEILDAARHSFPDLAIYLENTGFLDHDELSKTLHAYFERYKFLKLRNQISESFLQTVEDFALTRPFYGLPTRSSLLSLVNPEDTQLYFFDALGVEFLSFIIYKCKSLKLKVKTQICRCNLPSITAYNKEFSEKFNVRKISELDELKHHNQRYNYEACDYPVYIFKELNIIEAEIKRIHSELINGRSKNALIISDHGSSRLALLYAKDNQPTFELQDKAEHSGRCCKAEYDPKIPQVIFENDFAIIGSYQRFIGSKLYGLELHGGATLEEVVIPLIYLSV